MMGKRLKGQEHVRICQRRDTTIKAMTPILLSLQQTYTAARHPLPASTVIAFSFIAEAG